jgi:hypothetical protein
MRVASTRRRVRIGGSQYTEVSRDRVQESLELFKKRVEREHEREAPRYSFPSDKTRIRVLE